MVLCNKDCIPCCDFCIHVIHDMEEINGKMVRLAPIGCSLHKDEEHQDYVVNYDYCDDYYCFNAQ